MNNDKTIDPEHLSIDQPSESYDAAEQLLNEQETSIAEPLKPDDQNEPNEAMIFIEMCNLYDQMRSQRYDSAHILKTILSQFSITRK